jgi:SulP family sulfate permease
VFSCLFRAPATIHEPGSPGKRWDANQDLVGQGVGKLVSGLSGSFPTSTSFSRSAITLYSGAKTGWATVAAAGIVLLVLLFLTPALFFVPSAVLSAVVVAAVMGLIKPRVFTQLWQVDRVEAMTAAATASSSPCCRRRRSTGACWPAW